MAQLSADDREPQQAASRGYHTDSAILFIFSCQFHLVF